MNEQNKGFEYVLLYIIYFTLYIALCIYFKDFTSMWKAVAGNWSIEIHKIGLKFSFTIAKKSIENETNGSSSCNTTIVIHVNLALKRNSSKGKIIPFVRSPETLICIDCISCM